MRGDGKEKPKTREHSSRALAIPPGREWVHIHRQPSLSVCLVLAVILTKRIFCTHSTDEETEAQRG